MSNIKWKLASDRKITEKTAIEWQDVNGYSPCGYYFFDFKCEFNKELNMWVANWKCWDSCE